jgi:hypothetical protein
MINETEPLSPLTQIDHVELAKQLCYLAIGLNCLTKPKFRVLRPQNRT